MKNIVVSDDAHRALKVKAAKTGKTLKEVAEDAIARAIGSAAGGCGEGNEEEDEKKKDENE